MELLIFTCFIIRSYELLTLLKLIFMLKWYHRILAVLVLLWAMICEIIDTVVRLRRHVMWTTFLTWHLFEIFEVLNFTGSTEKICRTRGLSK